MKFYLGVHRPNWLEKTDVPLFVSRRTLFERRTLPRALGTWALDSGAFTEISTHGRWTLSAQDYADEVRRYRDEIGGLAWAAIQDWMCEPWILEKTGLPIEEHQIRTIESYAELTAIAPDLPWVPVLQGWTLTDYWRHADWYEEVGFDLRALPLVGLGSVCRRQGMDLASRIVCSLAASGLKLHGFGFKLTGLQKCGQHLASSDSMAWSFAARRSAPMPGHEHKNCANCLDYALAWRERVIDIERTRAAA